MSANGVSPVLSGSTPAAMSPVPTTAAASADMPLDPHFRRQLQWVPVWAVGWVAAAAAAHQLWAWLFPAGLNAGPLIVLCAAMVLAAVIDGWAFKVPNWLTLPLILSGWLLGLCHDVGWVLDAGTGGLGSAVVATLLGFGLLLPMLVLRGVGEGDVKMQMGFAAWVGAYFGRGETTLAAGWAYRVPALEVVVGAFVCGALFGGLFGLAMMLLRRRGRDSAAMFAAIARDVQLLASGQVGQAVERAEDRRKAWVRLPYGIPLCVGYLFYLWLVLVIR